MSIGPEALISIIRTDFDSVPLLDFLIDRGIDLQITHDVLQAAAGNFRYHRSLMTFLLERSDKAMSNDELFRAAADSGRVWVLQVLS